MAGTDEGRSPGTLREVPQHQDAGTGIRNQSGPTNAILPDRLSAGVPAALVFLFSLFFILTISNPAIYMNDEWITANQLHQLDAGHQLTLSEGKYGVTANGTVSAYFTSRQNVLM